MKWMGEDLRQRVERLESAEAIRQLVVGYALAIDSKDVNAAAALFASSTEAGGFAARRDAFVASQGDRFRTTVHLVSGHKIELSADNPDRATGTVYCRAEHEVKDGWIVAMLQYWDEYERRDGSWLFSTRDVKLFYVCDVLERPDMRDPVKYRLIHGRLNEAELPHIWPSWSEFWAEVDGRMYRP
jgi:hypothetical protein